MEERLKEVFIRVFNDSKIDDTISRENYEMWDSINHISLIVELESEFDIDIDPEEFQDIKDFKSVFEKLQNII